MDKRVYVSFEEIMARYIPLDDMRKDIISCVLEKELEISQELSAEIAREYYPEYIRDSYFYN